MTELNNNQDMLGAILIVTEAELQDLQHPINKKGDTRQGGSGLGKHAGMKVLVDMGPNTASTMAEALSTNLYKEVMALGDKSSSSYQDMSNAATLITPTNIDDPDNTDTSWTLTTATYADGLLTASGAAATNASQVVTGLKAGSYYIVGAVNRATADKAAKMVITGSIDGIVLTKTYDTATISAGDTEQDGMQESFTLEADQNLTIAYGIVAVAGGAPATGAAHIRAILESK